MRWLAKTVRVAATLTAAVVVPTTVAGAFAFVSGWRVHDVATNSMEPALAVGSIVVTKPVTASTVEAGDVVSFRTEAGTLVVHRVVRVVAGDRGNRFVTRGDANDADDQDLVDAMQLRGAVVTSIPGGGDVLAALFSDAARAAYVAVPLSLLAAQRIAARRYRLLIGT